MGRRGSICGLVSTLGITNHNHFNIRFMHLGKFRILSAFHVMLLLFTSRDCSSFGIGGVLVVWYGWCFNVPVCVILAVNGSHCHTDQWTCSSIAYFSLSLCFLDHHLPFSIRFLILCALRILPIFGLYLLIESLNISMYEYSMVFNTNEQDSRQ